MRCERTLQKWVEMYPDEMAEMLEPNNDLFNTLVNAPSGTTDSYKIFWDYLRDTQWNRMVLNPMHYIEAQDTEEIATMTRRIRTNLIANMDSLLAKRELLNQLRNKPLTVNDNYDISKEGKETLANHSFTTTAIDSTDVLASTKNENRMYQDKKVNTATTHTYDAVEVDTESSESHYENYSYNEPAITNQNEFNTKSITNKEFDHYHEHGIKNGKSIAENYEDIMNALSFNYIEEISKVVMKGFMYYIYS